MVLSFRETPIAGLIDVERGPAVDTRGWFARLFCVDEFRRLGQFPDGPIQINISLTRLAGTVRGLHYQDQPEVGPAEAKLVTCIGGRILDMTVDVRPDSRTYLRHHAVELTEGDNRSLLVPPGVAHGIQALEDDSTILYVNSAEYAPDLERGIRPDDPTLNLPWPLPVQNVSERDRRHPLFQIV